MKSLIRPLLPAIAVLAAEFGCVRPPHVLSAFRARIDVDGRLRAGPHAGVDFAAAERTPVIAAAEGEVSELTVNPAGCGLGVLILHGRFNRYTIYCHLDRVYVEKGQWVRRGAVIGRVGRTGNTAGVPHLHLELCRERCPTGHMDGYLVGVEDPLLATVGCFDPREQLPDDRLRLTFPLACHR